MWHDFSETGRGRVYLVTALGTAGCVAAALFVDSFTFSSMDRPALIRAVAVDILLPIVLAVPLLFFLMSKLRELAIANQKLEVLASTDSLTQVLARGAFTVLVDAYLTKFSQNHGLMRGALLVVDADDFKHINDQFGHSIGDEALRLIAASIRKALRDGDIVGRIGGDEFSIFLPGSTPSQAIAVAERIRESIQLADAQAFGGVRPLSVSIGGTTFSRETSFDALFDAADERLYIAKSRGRNRVEIEPMGAVAAGPA